MLRQEKGSTDGVSLRSYDKGRIYDLPADLAQTFVDDMGCAEYHTRSKPGPKPGSKRTGRKPSAKTASETPESGRGAQAPETPEEEGR